MNRLLRLLLTGLVCLLIVGVVKAAKKPPGAYISSAKIEVVSGDMERYQTAVALLDSLFMYYGPHAEGLFWMSQIMVDFVEKVADLEQKGEYVEKMVAYVDSLRMCCDNEDIKKKFRKDCEKHVQKSDSTLVSYWRTFFNSGVQQVEDIQKAAEDLKHESDPDALEYFQRRMEALIDSCEFNMSMAILIDSMDSRPYVGLSSVYEAKEEYARSNEWLTRALEKTDDRVSLLRQVAYNHIRLNAYCDAIPFLSEWVESFPYSPESHEQIITNMYNLTICYNNCGKYKEAYNVFHRVLEITPEDTRAMIGIGRYHNEMARYASDSAVHFQQQGDAAAADAWNQTRVEQFDSSKTYLKRAFALQKDDVKAAQEYGVVCYVTGDFESAIEAFKQISELQPDNTDNWISLGDCYLSTKRFPEAVLAYEKVVESEPENREILERLSGLYLETRQEAKKKQIDEKLENIP